VEQDKWHVWIGSDQRLKVGWRGRGKRDIIIPKAGMKLNRLLGALVTTTNHLGQEVNKVLIQTAVSDSRKGLPSASIGAGPDLAVNLGKNFKGLVEVFFWRNSQSGAVADNRLEANDFSVGDRRLHLTLKAARNSGEGVFGINEGNGSVLNQLGCRDLDSHNPSAVAASEVVKVMPRLDVLHRVQAIVDEDEGDALHAGLHPLIVALYAALLQGLGNGVPGRAAAKGSGELVDGADVGQRLVSSRECIAVSFGSDGLEWIGLLGRPLQQRMGMVINDGSALDGLEDG
jgi:hypothetical protein